MQYLNILNRWLAAMQQDNTPDEDLVAELTQLKNNNDGPAVEDRFYRELEFGTGGLRGVIGAGSNRINIYTVRKATQGLANWLNKSTNNKAVAIAYDSRNKSDIFAKEAARVLAANGIIAHIYPRLQPTPALSFAVRHLACGAGICITASHNPAEYNGYKVYGPDGCQITTGDAAIILNEIQQIDPFENVNLVGFKQGVDAGTIQYIPEAALDAFLAAVKTQSTAPAAGVPLKVVYTPLNGAGLECVTRILADIGIQDVTLVPEQKNPDGNFPTCPYPNPEIREALQKGLELCETVQPDILLATDPDCDRVGIAVRHAGEYHLLSGNQVGVLLLDYLCKTRIKAGTMPQKPVAVKTIVTTDMATAVAAKYKVELREVLTGFKFIGEQIGLLEKEGHSERYIFGFEESYGYLSGAYVRDKDAVNAAMLICEMAQSYKQAGKTLLDAMNALYNEFGGYANLLLSFEYKGASGMQQMAAIMEGLRTQPPKDIHGLAVVGVMDYLTGVGHLQGEKQTTALPASNVLDFKIQQGARVIVRPSGTEPKIKLYISTVANTYDAAQALCQALGESAIQLLNV